MAYVRTFEDFTPPRRYDSLPFTDALIRESATQSGSYTTVDTIALVPTDADPAHPISRDLTTDQATLAEGWYIVRWRDAALAVFDSDPVYYPATSEHVPFITVDEVGDLIGRDLSQDPGATLAVAGACGVCRDVAEQTFTAGSSTVALDGSGGDVLVLPEYPVGAITSVTVAGAAITDYLLDTEVGLLFRGTAGESTWPIGRRNVSVSYTHGYETIPASVKQVALNLAHRCVAQGIARTEAMGDIQVTYGLATAADLSDNELRILRRYRRTRSF